MGIESGDLVIVAMLVVLEGLLSCDNAVVLATMVRHLPPEQRGRALRYGILGAYVFRTIALMAATYVMTIWWLKVAGGLYLCWIGISALLKGGHGDEEGASKVRRIPGFSVFWSTVLAVELADMVFSVDSIAAAVALSDKLWVLIAGGLMGILAMRFAAQGFLYLLQRFPRLESAAMIAVAMIGLKLLLEAPVDLVGDYQPVAATYTTAAEYHALASEAAWMPLHAGDAMHLCLAAPEPPRADLLSGSELARAQAIWNLHLRPFIHLDGMWASLGIALVFACGFIGGGSASGTTNDDDDALPSLETILNRT